MRRRIPFSFFILDLGLIQSHFLISHRCMSVINGFYIYSASGDLFHRALMSSKKTSTPIQSYGLEGLCHGSGFDDVDTVYLITVNTAGRLLL